MPSSVLLSPDTHPLRTLTLARLQLGQADPVCTLTTGGEEVLLYPLVGTVRVRDAAQDWGTLGGRRAVTEPRVQALRFPAGRAHAITVQLVGYAADLLVASCVVDIGAVAAVAHWEDVVCHPVGDGTHAREVREVPTPLGYQLYSGETLNIPGGVSSWPPHANTEDLAKFAAGLTTWEEGFFVVCPEPGVAVLEGYYSDQTPVDEVIRLENGTAYVMPLGSHACYAAPGSYLWYFWVYCGNALHKEYRQWASDVGTYRK